MRLHPSVLLATAALLLAACGSGGTPATDGPGDAATPTPSYPAVTYTETVEWRAPQPAAPSAQAVTDLVTTINGAVFPEGVSSLDQDCPMGEAGLLYSALPTDLGVQDSHSGQIDEYNELSPESNSAFCKGERAQLTAAPLARPLSPEIIIGSVIQYADSAIVSAPVPYFAGSAFTYCYTTASNFPGCGGGWFDEQLLVHGTMFGTGSTAQGAADWLTVALPAMLANGRGGGPAGTARIDYEWKNPAGYSFAVEATGLATTTKIDIANALPGKATVTVTLAGRATVRNTTAGRNALPDWTEVRPAWRLDSEICRQGLLKGGGLDELMYVNELGDDVWRSAGFCMLAAGARSTVGELAAGAADTSPYAAVGDAPAAGSLTTTEGAASAIAAQAAAPEMWLLVRGWGDQGVQASGLPNLCDARYLAKVVATTAAGAEVCAQQVQ